MIDPLTDSELADYVLRRLGALLHFARTGSLPLAWRTCDTALEEDDRE